MVVVPTQISALTSKILARLAKMFLAIETPPPPASKPEAAPEKAPASNK